MIRKPLFLLASISLLSCALSSSVDNSPEVFRSTSSATKNPKHVRLIVTERHYLELEPCGCSMHPMGGMQREQNAIQALRSQDETGTFWTMAVGTSFVPTPQEFKPELVDRYRLKANYLLDGMKLNQTSAVGVTAEDMILGEEKLRELEKRGGFPFISANLYSEDGKRRLFKPYVTLETGGTPILFLSVTDPADTAYRVMPKVTVRPPEEALKEVFASLPKGERLVVMAASLPDRKVRDIRAKFPQIRLWLGGLQNESYGGVIQPTRDFAHLWLVHQGRAVGMVEFDAASPLPAGWYSPAQITYQQGQIEKHQYRLADFRKYLKGKLDKSSRDIYQFAVKDELQAIKEAKAMAALKPGPNLTYLYQLIELEDSFDSPHNRAGDIVDKYKAEMHDLAVAAEE